MPAYEDLKKKYKSKLILFNLKANLIKDTETMGKMVIL